MKPLRTTDNTKADIEVAGLPATVLSPFSVVGIGASAGGLDPLRQMVSHLPRDTGLAFVIVQHLAPGHASLTSEILAKDTPMPVVPAQEGVLLVPNYIYVMQPNSSLRIEGRRLRVRKRSDQKGLQFPINLFFNSLAEDLGRHAIGVVLSGMGIDGTEGLKAIKAKGGVALVQDPESTEYSEMPRSAISSGVADFVQEPRAIASALNDIAKHPYLIPREGLISDINARQEELLKRVFDLLHSGTGANFSQYKRSTVRRRISRRMLLRKTEDLAGYVRILESDPREVRALFSDILIHVTSFFRDSKVFDFLRTRVLPKYMKNWETERPLRIWVPACSTGEETYSLAMTIMEFLDQYPKELQPPAVVIFATDISDQALQRARAGIYPESIREELSEARLKRFFEPAEGGGYRIAKWLRSICLFSKHDLTRDPPFARVDLISCRNLLIYFDSELQKKVLPVFHYALNPEGILILGRSETVGGFSNLFTLVDKSNKLYTKRQSSTLARIAFPMGRHSAGRMDLMTKGIDLPLSRTDLKRESDRVIISEYAPPGVMVDDALEIVQSHGRLSPFVELGPGQPSLNLLRMIHPQLSADLRALLQAVRKKNAPVKKEGILFSHEGVVRSVTLKIVPVQIPALPKERHFSIFFEETEAASRKSGPKTGGTSRVGRRKVSKRSQAVEERRASELQKQLEASQDYQQSLIEQYENAQEELISSNEELQSTNEELQSTNEELETAKEELQSSNEELTTVNDVLETRNTEMMQLNNDLTNLLASVDIPIVMVGADGKIRRFTPMAGKALKLIPGDVGRPIGDIKPNIDAPDLDRLVREVMETVSIRQLETRDPEGQWYQLQVRPYRTSENKIEGAVISILDIDVMKRSSEEMKLRAGELKKSRDDTQMIIEAQPLPLLVIDSRLRVVFANNVFYERFQLAKGVVEGSDFVGIGNGEWNIPDLIDKVRRTLDDGVMFDGFEVTNEFLRIGPKTLILSARRVHLPGSNTDAALLAIEDITKRKMVELEAAEARKEAERASNAKDLFLATLSHELRTPLTSILSWTQLLHQGRLDPTKARRGLEILMKSAQAQGQLINDLLDISRIQSGKLVVNVIGLDPKQAILSALDSVQSLIDEKEIEVKTAIDSGVGEIVADPDRLQQILWNLLTNAIRFTPKGGKISMRLGLAHAPLNQAEIEITDTGKGIEPEFLPRVFDSFSQADSTSTRYHGGLGLGLAIVRNLVLMQGGTVGAKSDGSGKGATFTIRLPLRDTKEERINEDPLFSMAHKEESPVRLDGLSILLVDDEANSCEVFSVMLETYGAQVKCAASAAEGLSAFLASKPDLLLSDIAMPGEDGYSLISKIRALPAKKGRDVPAIALTAFAGGEDFQRALEAGFDRHLAKPIEVSKLTQTIASLIKEKRSGSRKK